MKFSAAALANLVALAHPAKGQSSCPPPPIATKVKVQSTTGAPLTIRELRIFSDSINVAVGKNATQSSTLHASKDASKAVDGKWGTYSSTGEQVCGAKWLEVDLNEPVSIDKVLAVNRKCSDNPSCGCQLSYATVSLLDSNGDWVDMKATKNTCNKGWVGFPFKKKCPTASPTTAAPITSSPSMSPSVSTSSDPLTFMGNGWCFSAQNKLYDYLRYDVPEITANKCLETCPQTSFFLGMSVRSDYNYCFCFYENNQLPANHGAPYTISSNTGTGPITGISPSTSTECYKFN